LLFGLQDDSLKLVADDELEESYSGFLFCNYFFVFPASIDHGLNDFPE